MPVDPEPHPDWLRPQGLPAEVGALMATRAGGVSHGPFASLNLRPPGPPGPSTGATDDDAAVLANQQRFAAALGGARPIYLDQVHGVRVVHLRAADGVDRSERLRADASVTTEPGLACTVLVADCLPVLLAAPRGLAVGAAHAGWRGLAGGVVEAAVEAVCRAAPCRPDELSSWLGPCIGPRCFEVGDEVRQAFGAAAAAHFVALPAAGKYLADLPGLARQRLAAAGVQRIAGGDWCTFSEPSRFFSFRRDRVTGRHAAAIWIRA